MTESINPMDNICRLIKEFGMINLEFYIEEPLVKKSDFYTFDIPDGVDIEQFIENLNRPIEKGGPFIERLILCNSLDLNAEREITGEELAIIADKLTNVRFRESNNKLAIAIKQYGIDYVQIELSKTIKFATPRRYAFRPYGDDYKGLKITLSNVIAGPFVYKIDLYDAKNPNKFVDTYYGSDLESMIANGVHAKIVILKKD